MSVYIDVTDETFKEIVLDSSVPVLVDFWAPWCGPCREIAPLIDELAKEVGDTARICKLNIDNSQQTAVEYGVMSIPTLLVFQNGTIKQQFVGKQSLEDLKEALFQGSDDAK
jgi:thioredoxin 1